MRPTIMPSDSEQQRPPDSPDESSPAEAREPVPPPAAHPPARNENDPTVISKSAPALMPTVPSGLHPLQLGEQLEGEQLDHFHLEKFIGGGGMGAVFRALDTLLNRTVAVKVLAVTANDSGENHLRFQVEAQSAARLDHENIARVYYVGEDHGVCYIVFEYIDGVNLRDLVNEQGPLPWAEAVQYAIQITDAIAHAHERDVVHRDIKPSNVLVTASGRAKLVDMGLARLHQIEQPANDITQSGVTLGTFDYISPEQARDPRLADVRSDLYSLGCTIYFVLTGQPPFPDGTALQKLLQHQADPPPDPRELRPDLPDELAVIVKKLLSKSAKERHQSPVELLNELTAVAQQFGLAVPTHRHLAPLRTDTQGWNYHLPWLIPVFLFVLLTFGMAVAPVQQLKELQLPTVPTPPPRQELQPTDPPAGVSTERGNPDEVGITSPGSQPSEDRIAPSTDVSVTPRSSAGGQTTAAETEPIADSPSFADNVSHSSIVVDPESDDAYATLTAACRAADSGDVIEIQVPGRLTSFPLELADKRLTIRAADGFRPEVVFQMDRSSLSPTEQRGMINVRGGELTIEGVNLTYDLTDAEAAAPRALFQVDNAKRITLNDCWITLVREQGGHFEGQADTALFSAAWDPTGELSTSENPFEQRLAIELRESLLRGQAHLLWSDGRRPLALTCRHSRMALLGQLLHLEVGDQDDHSAASIKVELDHVIAAVGGVVTTLYGNGEPAQDSLAIVCQDSQLLALEMGTPMIDQHGRHAESLMKNALFWQGNANDYEGWNPLWRVSPTGAMPDEVMLMNEWQSHWKAVSDWDASRYSPQLWPGLARIRSALHRTDPGEFDTRRSNPLSGERLEESPNSSDDFDPSFSQPSTVLPTAVD